MGIISRMRSPRPQAFVENWLSDRVVDFFNGGPTASGVRIGSDSAMRVSTFFACTNVLSQDVGKLPLILYRRLPDGGRERAIKHPLYQVLHGRPNQFQTSYRWRQTGQTHLILRGNTYARITRYRDQVRELLPIHPDRMTVKLDEEYRLRYRVDGNPVDAKDILHVRGLSLDGYTGVSVPHWARESLGLAAATEQHGARLFGNGALFRGLLKHPGKLKDEVVAKRMRESFDAMGQGDNQHRTALLEDGVTYEKVSMTPEDSQFLETREFQGYELCRWFRMPPHKVGLMKQATFSNIEHQALEYVTDTLLSWLINWEQELNAALLTEAEQSEFFFEHLVDGLLRGDLKSRYQAFKDAILTGFMSRNEARARENMNPGDGLDEFLEPMNMAPAGEPREEILDA
jgi:HK97 family phage portal protein